MPVFADWSEIANLAYWVTGTEGSNPSLSATQFVEFTYNLEMAANSRGAGRFAQLVAAERATNLANRQFAPIPLCSEEIRCHERVVSDRALAVLRSLDRWSLVGQKRRASAL